MHPAPLAVDLFAGEGGWTAELLAAGFRVVGVDIRDRPPAFPEAADYVQADVRHVDGRAFRGARVVVASVPCPGFSLGDPRPEAKWEKPRPADFELLAHSLRIIGEADPVWWAVENVRGAFAWFEPILGAPRHRGNPYYLWGRFPPFLQGDCPPKTRHRSAALRAKIPAQLARPFARACAGQRQIGDAPAEAATA